jgi:hypothetical protein
MHDHRLPRHDRPPEPWLPHPGTPDAAPPAPMPLLGDTASPSGLAPRPVNAPFPAPTAVLRPGASLFARFVLGLVQGRKSIPVAIGFAVLGPLGLFYVSFLNGVAALLIVPIVIRALALGSGRALGAGEHGVTLAVILCWCITIPWAIVAARRRNARLGL